MGLIDAEDVKELLKGLDSLPWDEEVDDIVDGLPTVEAVPVVRGEWDEKIMNYFCSQCKKAFDDDLVWITGEFKLPNFCPECGADMRKKVE